MSKNAAKIKTGLQHLSAKPYEILSGTVVSVDEATATMSVQPTDYDTNLDTVLLNGVGTNLNGLILIPSVGSNVIIGSVDGPGEYALIRASNIDKALLNIGATELTIDKSGYSITHNGESLTKIMSDLLTALIEQTFSNGAGTTTPSSKLSALQELQMRLNNLLI
ncbi:MAG: hypothetical protein ACTHJ0_09760 [Flavipsychrobacter sp.]